MKPKACIVLPTYNEAANVRILLPQIFDQAAAIDSHELHVLVVDDNSPDGTQDVVRELMSRFPHVHLVSGEKKGLGEAYKRGFQHALRELDPDLILQMDADLQHSPELIPLFVKLTQYGFTLVIGSRLAPGGSTPEFSLRRRLLSLFGNWLIRFLGGLPRLHDCTSGYRCIQAELIKRCDFSFLSTRGYSFQSSLLFELLRNGARPIEVPIVFSPRTHGQSKLAVRDQLEFLFNILRIRFRRSTEFVRFCCVGASGVLVNMGIYVWLTRGLGVRLELASPLAIETSILSNFAFNTIWTFRERNTSRSLTSRLLRFHLVSAVAGITNYATLLLLVRAVHISDILANLCGIAVATLLNYSMNSLWTWKEVAGDDGSPRP